MSQLELEDAGSAMLIYGRTLGAIIQKKGVECVRGKLVIFQWFRVIMKCLLLLMDRRTWIRALICEYEYVSVGWGFDGP